MDLIVLFLVENHLGIRFPAGILRKRSELGVGLPLLVLTAFRTENLASSSQKWQHRIADLVDRAAPYPGSELHTRISRNAKKKSPTN